MAERLKQTDMVERYVYRHMDDVASCLVNEMACTPTGYPVDKLTITERGREINGKTSPTNIGLYIASLVAFRDNGSLTEERTHQLLEGVVASLESADTYGGLYYNWYDVETGNVSVANGSEFVSTVDNAWLAAGMMVAKQAEPRLAERYERLLERMQFGALYDQGTDSFYGGIDTLNGQMSQWHYGVLATEARIASYIGVGKYGVPVNHAQRMYRQLTNVAMEPRPIRSWGGSMFEMCMPGLFVDEGDGKTGLGRVVRGYVAAQVAYGKEHIGGHWGLSPCESPDDGYIEAGVPGLGLRYNGEDKDFGYEARSIVTPHAVALALPYATQESLNEMRRLECDYPSIYHPGLGFADSVNIENGHVASSYLALDQAMIALSLSRYANGHGVTRYMAAELMGEPAAA